MNVRHRIPSIFNLSMVDVLCCALGCVILLWLFYLRLAKQHQEIAEAQHRETAALLDTARGERDDAYALVAHLAGQLHDLDRERDGLRRQVADQQAAHAELESKWKASAAAAAAVEADLRTSRKQTAELEDKLKASAGRVASLENDVRAVDRRYQAQLARAAELLRKLEGAELRWKDAQAEAERVPALQTALKEAKSQAAREGAMAAALEKEIAKRVQDLAAAGKDLAAARAYKDKWEKSEERGRDLEQRLATQDEERRNLKAEAGRWRAAAENRFAGIELTGRRVVFLVDMSGSMDLVDEKTPAPDKWPEVGRTVGRLMGSLPDLEKFQVVVFSEKASYLLGGDGWLDFDPRTSARRVVDALAALKPDGGTNMYAALQAAFHLRGQGLDTIYLLSDGLPNQGAGLPDDAAKLTEEQRNDLCSRYIRRTLKTTWNAPRPGQPRVRINAVGFFFESPDVGAFLWALARENEGSFVGMSKP